jgi:hypothetical protein
MSFNLDTILQQSDNKNACDRVIAYLQAVADRIEDERTCYQQFHKIVWRIFGFEGSYVITQLKLLTELLENVG